jgi:hypothetical protein
MKNILFVIEAAAQAQAGPEPSLSSALGLGFIFSQARALISRA